MDFADLISDLSTGSYTVTRRAAAVDDGHGRMKPGAQSSFPIQAACVQPRGRELLRLPEGRRADEARMVYTLTELLVGGQAASHEADLILIDGATYEVSSVDRWPDPEGGPPGFVSMVMAVYAVPGGPVVPIPPAAHLLLVDCPSAPIPLFQAAGGGVAPIDWTALDGGASQIDALVGLLMAPAAAGEDVIVVPPFQSVAGFGAWPVGTILWALASGLGLYSSVPVGKWTRRLGVVQDGGALLFQLGEPAQKE